MKHPRPEQMAADIGEDAADLVRLLAEAVAVQYERSRRISTVEDAGVRSKGTIARPTEDTALDPVRLALRAEVQDSVRLLLRTHRDLYHRRQRLLTALDRWNGDPLTDS